MIITKEQISQIEALPTYESYENDKVVNRDAVLSILRQGLAGIKAKA